MNTESEIIQLRLLDAEATLIEWSEDSARRLAREHRKEVRRLKKSIDIESEADVDRVISSLAASSTPAIADSFATAGASSLATTEQALSWDGKYTGYKPAAMSQNQLKGLALTEKVNGKSITAHLDTAIGQQVRGMISDARIKGEGIDKMTSKIWNSLGGQVSRRNIETVSRTYTATASNYAKRLTYEQNSDVIKGYQWCATLENGNWKTGRGTCPRCAALDQREYKSLADIPPLPLHPNCRCLPTPITKTWKEMGLDVPEMNKASRPWTERLESGRKKEYGTSDQSYGDWWLTKGKTWQNSSTVGPTRAKMIRAGQIKYEDIVDPKTGKLYTIKQLASGKPEEDRKKAVSVDEKRKKAEVEKARKEAEEKRRVEREKKESKAKIEREARARKEEKRKKAEAKAEKLKKQQEAKKETEKTPSLYKKFLKLAPGVDEEAGREAEKLLSKIPNKVWKKIEEVKNLKTFGVVKDSAVELLPHLKGVSVPGHPPGTTFDKIDGVYDPDTLTAIASIKDIKFASKNIGPRSESSVIFHELGHVTDYAFRDEKWVSASSTKPFITARDRDIKDGYLVKGKHDYFLQPGTSGREETFAEIFGVYVKDKDTCKELYPSMYSYFKKILEE